MPPANNITMPTPTIIPVMERFLLRLPLRMILAAAKPIQPQIVGTAGNKKKRNPQGPTKKATISVITNETQKLLAMLMV